jgi:hypothetical protein
MPIVRTVLPPIELWWPDTCSTRARIFERVVFADFWTPTADNCVRRAGGYGLKVPHQVGRAEVDYSVQAQHVAPTPPFHIKNAGRPVR